jgi:hypothetical protein
MAAWRSIYKTRCFPSLPFDRVGFNIAHTMYIVFALYRCKCHARLKIINNQYVMADIHAVLLPL